MMRERRGSISEGMRAAVYARDGWRCQYCGMQFIPDPGELSGRWAPCVRPDPDEPSIWLEIDHVRPIKFGGDHSFGNLRAACSPCNRTKAVSTNQVDWPARIAIAARILAEGKPTKRTAERAAEALIGERVRLRNVRTTW